MYYFYKLAQQLEPGEEHAEEEYRYPDRARRRKARSCNGRYDRGDVSTLEDLRHRVSKRWCVNGAQAVYENELMIPT